MSNERRAGYLSVRVTAAWAVHLFSATGAVLALVALFAVWRHQWMDALLWLFAALIVDGVDGTLARAARVKDLAPRIDGDAMDLVVDYLTYVFVPTALMCEASLLPSQLRLPLASLVLLSSLYVFARRDMKTDDGYFRGFPALWNIVVLYLFTAGLQQNIAAIIVVIFVLLTFAPIHFVHPFRVRDYGISLPFLAIAWAAATLALLVPGVLQWFRSLLLLLSTFAALTLVTLGLLRSAKGPRSRRCASPENR